MRLIRSQKGDTIIEVLFAITILTVVLSACYAIANRAITTSRLNYERTQGLKHAESQVEILKAVSESTGMTTASFLTYKNQDAWKNGDHCLTRDNQIKLSTDTSCKPLGLYTLSLRYVPGSGEESGYFVSRVAWGDDNPANARNVETIYRVYNSVQTPGATSSSAPVVPTAPADNDGCSMSGTKTRSGNYIVHTFTSATPVKTFVTTCNLTVEYLVIGGGGAGGAGNVNEGGGGGGAGGMVEGSYNATAAVGTYALTIGAGGASVSNTRSAPSNGQSSSIFGITALGGGGGGSCWDQANSSGGPGANGGSGGGGSGCQTSGAGGAATQVAPGFGRAGGAGQWSGGGTNGCNGNGGGGGGAGGAGQSGAARAGSCSGAGSVGGFGAGKVSALTGQTYAIGGNGAAGRSTANGIAGADGTGSGGSGSSGNADGTAGNHPSGKGGTGIIIIRYAFLK